VNQTELDTALAGLADPSYRTFNARIVPTAQRMYGVRMPALRQLAKTVLNDDWPAFLTLSTQSFEQSMMRALIIGTAPMSGVERLAYTLQLVPEIDNWCVCDLLCSCWKVDGPVTAAALWHYCAELLDTDEEFPMRVGAVMLMDRFRDREHLATALELLTAHRHPGYYFQMGQAWALSFFYIEFPAETEAMLFSDRLDPPVLRMAIRKIGDSYRVPATVKATLKARLKAAHRMNLTVTNIRCRSTLQRRHYFPSDLAL